MKIPGHQFVLKILPVQKLFPFAFRQRLLWRKRFGGLSRRRLLAALDPVARTSRSAVARGGRP